MTYLLNGAEYHQQDGEWFAGTIPVNIRVEIAKAQRKAEKLRTQQIQLQEEWLAISRVEG